MANTKEYSIKINGLQESIKQVDALSDSLQFLEQRIKNLEGKAVNLGGSSNGSSTKALQEQDKLLKQIQETEQKIRDARREDYQSLLAAKDILKDATESAKERAAAERLSTKSYANTMKGMKEELADIKRVMQSTDLGSDKFKQLSNRANDLNKKLLETEKEYGQFGRQVGNYQAAFDGMDKLTVQVGDVTREFNSAREAARTLYNELVTLEASEKGDTKEAEELRKAYYNLKSAMDDATKSSKAMDDAMDWMQSFSAMASVGNGLKAFFGFDDNEITKSIQRLVALQGVLSGIETIRKQMETSEGIGKILGKGSEMVDQFVDNIFAAEAGIKGVTKASKLATFAARSLSIALKSIGIGIVLAGITLLMKAFESISSAIKDYFKGNAEIADATHVSTSSINAENNALKEQRDILSSKYLKGYIDDVEYARKNVVLLTDAIQENINEVSKLYNEYYLLKDSLKTFGEFLTNGFGKDGIKVKSDFLDISYTIKNIEDAKDAWKDFYKAVKSEKDVITATGARSVSEWFASFVVTADDAKDDFTKIGQIIAANWVNNIETLNIATDEGKQKLEELVTELNNDEVTNSVMMNLDKYFPDEAIVKRIQNVIKYAQELENSLKFDREESQEGANYWQQVRIDAMTGAEKIRAQVDLNHRKELEQLEKNGRITNEHRKQLAAKYNRQLQEQLKQFNNQAKDAQNDLTRVRIDAMKEGLEKELAQIEEERKEKIRKIKESGILVGERTLAINELYDKKILEAKKNWANDMLRVYQDLNESIVSINKTTFNMEGDIAEKSVNIKSTNSKRDAANSIINSTNYYDTRTLEEYYDKVLEIEKKANEREAQIQQERLDKQLEYSIAEEKLRHERLVNAQSGDYAKQLELGKITQEQYDKLIEDETDAHNARMNALNNEYAVESSGITQDMLIKQERLYNQYYTDIANNIKKDKQKIDEIVTTQPQVDNIGFDVILISKARRAYKEASAQYEKLKNTIIQKQKELDKALKDGHISAEDYAIRQSELDQEIDEINNAQVKLKEKQKNLSAEFASSVNRYVQEAGQIASQILSSVSDIIQNNYDRQISELEKYIDEYEELLDKQAEITENHADKINSIEDELKTARGDRRQELIDNLNAEMAAQRASLAQEKKIEREKKKMEYEKEMLEWEAAKKEREINLWQAAVNAAMAVSMAAVNKWPEVAIPMMALAAAVGAAQLAAVASTPLPEKPTPKYADGGVLEGPSHAQGGIKVLGGQAEVEGNEYVIRKKSTVVNLPLLDYINKSERKLNLEDFIDFYTNKTGAAKNIQNVKYKFAEGGQLPMLRNDISLNNEVINAMNAYANKPTVVQVVDIVDATDNLNKVKVLSGLQGS